LTEIRFVRITDLDLGTGFDGSAEGFDLDAVVSLHALPLVAAGTDSDGDGLTDAEEIALYGSDPFDADTDGDGTPDGVEAAICRSPVSASTAPFFVYEDDLGFGPGSSDSLRWNFPGGSLPSFDLIRGDLGGVDAGSDPVDLGPVTCVEDNSFNLTSADHPDAAVPAPGEGFFYLLRLTGGSYGIASDGRPRQAGAGDCAP
ncbi:MAG TPA: hypothetical protein VNI57_10820, partial [Candidatus Saccharimonadales bacterium]|nr:hypothetical protein [Candidatus Saccharimonadales bacterium]